MPAAAHPCLAPSGGHRATTARTPRNRLRAALPLFAIVAVACGGGGGGGGDASARDGSAGDDAGTAAAIPWLAEGMPPVAPPDLTPCPPGFRTAPRADLGIETCEPFPEGGATRCPPGEAHFVGEPGCAPIGSPCPVGEWPEGLPTDTPVVFVRPGAGGGDGSRGAPFGTIGAGTAAAPRGATIALAGGTYDESVTLPASTALRGACAASTILTASSGMAVVTVGGAGTGLQDLAIADSARPGLWIEGPSSEVHVRGVEIANVEGVGINAYRGAGITATGLVVRDTRPRSSDGAFGRGLNLERDVTTELSRVVVSDNRATGILVLGAGSSLILEDAVVRDTLSQVSDGTFGRGLGVQESHAEVRRCLFEANRQSGVYGAMGASLVLEDAWIRDTEGRASDDDLGYGLWLQGATVEGRRLVFERNRHVAVNVERVTTGLRLSDTVVADTRPRAVDNHFGFGLAVEDGATAALERILFHENRNTGVEVSDPGTTASLTDAVIRGTLPRGTELDFGRGLEITDGAAVDATRLIVDDNREVGIVAQGPDSSLRMTAALVRGTLPQESDGFWGRGLGAQEGARVDVSQALFEANHEVTISVFDPDGRFTLTDTVIRDSRERPADGAGGRAIIVEEGGSIDGSRVTIEDSRQIAVFVHGEGSRATLRETTVSDTRERSCTDTTCERGAGGMGVGAYLGGSVAMTDFRVSRSDFCGVQVADGGTMDLTTGLVSNNLIGACVGDPGFDISRLMNDVRYLDNGTQLDTTVLPVPEPSL